MHWRVAERCSALIYVAGTHCHVIAMTWLSSSYHCDAVTLSWASDVTPGEGFTFVAIHPGSVETDMNNATFG